MASEKFCLRWNEFENNISQAFKELRDDKDFFDVTLACDDEQIQAHKVILSACSPFFRNILRRNPHQHPLLYLKGVKYSDLQSVLNFMYHGEVNVAQEELNSFLAVAEELRVKGLTQNTQQSSQSTNPKQTYPVPPKSPAPQKTRPPDREPSQPPKRAKPSPAPIPNYTTADDDEIQEVVPVKSEPHDINNSAVNVYEHHHQAPVQSQVASHPHALAPAQTQLVQDDSLHYAGDESYEDYGGYEGDQGYGGLEANISATDGNKGPSHEEILRPDDLYKFCIRDEGHNRWSCTICYEFSHQGRQRVRNHVESKHYPTTFQYFCDKCDKICNTKKALEVHTSEKHRAPKMLH